MPTRFTVVAIDGPSGSGKSSVSKAVAAARNWAYVDTGAMYRAVAWAVLEAGVDPGDPRAVEFVAANLQMEVGVDPDDPSICVSGRDVAADIRSADVTAAVSAVAAVASVRERLVRLQRQLVDEAAATGQGIVVEGRDIGSVVLPEADLKVFLVADPSARAQRRANQEAEESTAIDGVSALAREEVLQSLTTRDLADSTRTVSPLTAPEDAVHIDATYLSLDQVVARVSHLLAELKSHSESSTVIKTRR